MNTPIVTNSPGGLDVHREYAKVERLIGKNLLNTASTYVEQIAGKYAHDPLLCVFLGMVLHRMGSSAEAVGVFANVTEDVPSDLWPAIMSPECSMYVQAQLGLGVDERPASLRGRQYLAANIEALRGVDPQLADEAAQANMPENIHIVDVWGRLYVYDSDRRQLMQEQAGVIESMRQWWKHPTVTTAIVGLGTGQELIMTADNLPVFDHNMTKSVYFFPADVGQIVTQLSLADLSARLADQRVIVIGGQSAEQRLQDVFGSLEHPIPGVFVEAQNGPAESPETRIRQLNDPTVWQQQATEYYSSDTFRRRLDCIVRGEVTPRVMVVTCRWTTFLKYCADDFCRAFESIGCQARYIIERSDVSRLTTSLMLREIAEFMPDVVFQVSHSRPSLNIPRELPTIGFIMDKCGKLASIEDLGEVIEPHDMLIGMMDEFGRYLNGKGVPEAQIRVMPTPADERTFYPVTDSTNIDGRYVADVAFVKHGVVDLQQLFDHYMREGSKLIKHRGVQQKFDEICHALREQFCTESSDERVYESQIRKAVRELYGSVETAQDEHYLDMLADQFYMMVFSGWWRCRFIEHLDQAGIQVALYGTGWHENTRLKHLSRGPVPRGEELNLVYNYCKINLNIHPCSTMHQRITECGLAGGFMLNAWHDEAFDWEPVTKYYQSGSEIVMFTTADDLVEKCRYYLQHDQERCAIARRFREKTLSTYTTQAAARKTLVYWREVLEHAGYGGCGQSAAVTADASHMAVSVET